MGDLNVKVISTQKQLNDFTRYLLKDIHALERMLAEDWFNKEPLHIGAEQEICIVDNHYKPVPKSMSLLEKLDDSFTTELALFNIEANLDPLPYTGSCFSQLEANLNEKMNMLRALGDTQKLDFVLTGILPTIRKFDLEIENLTPLERYRSLLKAIAKMRGNNYELRISGLDELNLKHDSAMLESCNTSFQVHLQVTPEEFVQKYNIAQALAAPVLAISCNSPLLLGKRLWSETRVALFQQSVDTRITGEHIRDRSPRVTFGNDWLRNSIVDMYKDDIVRYRVMLMSDFEPDVMALMDQGITPKLRALTIHNSTVYRWNRPCYGVSPDGRPHLRIENRVLPSGPSTIDEVSNAAFWIGLMSGFNEHYPNIEEKMEFHHAKDNFFSAAHDGMNTDFAWIGGKKVDVQTLIKEELLPIAREGLEKNNIAKADIDRYLEVIEERNESRQTGTQWIVDSHTKLGKLTSREEVLVGLTCNMIENQRKGLPVHKWELASLESLNNWTPHTMLVEEFMTTDLFTVQANDIPELVADIINWRKIKHVPVEDDKGRIKGMINYRVLLKYYSKKMNVSPNENVMVKDLMDTNPTTIHPEATVSEALALMKSKTTDCLPVVKNGKLVGIITEGNFLNITASILKNLSSRD
ncbi:MAG: glutamate-cysteine ligase family protein [Cyclobacteriaceae bacterium]